MSNSASYWRCSLLLSGLLLLSARALAQRVLLRADVAADTTYNDYGPNRRYYNHFYLGYAAVAGASADGAPIHYGQSGEFFLGVRNKLRLNQTVAVGFDVRYARLAYHLRQTSNKTVPTPVLHYREYIAIQQVQSELFGRVNYGRRGNAIGRYVDLLAWGGYALGSVHFYEDRPGANGSRKQRVSERGLGYMQRWPYGVGARAGIGRYAVLGRYRLSDTFTPPAAARYPELPRWTVGLELSWL